MPYTIKRSGRFLAVALGALALSAGPAQAKGALANSTSCTPNGALAQHFAVFGDSALYTPVANAGLEQGAASWTLTGGAAVAGGNEPWKIGGGTHSFSLDLPTGSSAVTAPLCIDVTYPFFRLFARNTGGTGSLKIEILAYDTKGKLLKTAPYSYTATGADWKLTPTIPITVFDYKKAGVTAAPVSFRFTPTGANARFSIDDVYVDPWARH